MQNIFYRIFIFCIMVCTACTNVSVEEGSDEAGSSLSKIESEGKLVAVTDYNSTNYFIYKGSPMGFQYEMLKALADYLGVNLEIVVGNELQNNFDLLEEGDVNLIALNLTITKERSKTINFTRPIMQTRQVLVQRKPKDWRKITRQEINLKVIRNQLNLAGKTIYVQENSSHAHRLKHLASEIGDSIDIVEVPMVAEELVKLVSEGDIDYTICDENVAKVNQTYYPNIDIQTAVSFPQYIAWAVGSDQLELEHAINAWLENFQTTLTYTLIYKKYFENRKSATRVKSEFYAINSGKISPYDTYIKKYIEPVGWDWRLLASLMYQESRFKHDVKSWAGAVGLMQLMPKTAERFGASIQSGPEQNIQAGINFIKWLDNKLLDTIQDSEERKKFVLASYNVGLGHILDARRLAEKYGKDPNTWQDNVDYFLLNKSKPGFYRDPVVRYGYCRGEEPYYYVIEIIERYEHYKNLIPEG